VGAVVIAPTILREEIREPRATLRRRQHGSFPVEQRKTLACQR